MTTLWIKRRPATLQTLGILKGCTPTTHIAAQAELWQAEASKTLCSERGLATLADWPSFWSGGLSMMTLELRGGLLHSTH